MFGQMCMLFAWCAGIVILDIYFFVNFVNDKRNPVWWAIAATVVLAAAFVFSGLHLLFTFVEWMQVVHNNFE